MAQQQQDRQSTELQRAPFSTPYVTLPELEATLRQVGLHENALVASALAQAQRSHANQRRAPAGRTSKSTFTR